jgi:magnesium and cobalt transporter
MGLKFFRKRNNSLEEIINGNGHAIEKEEREMIRGVFGLGETPVKSIMVPRTDVVAVPLDEPFDAIVKTFVKSRHSRIPVYDSSIDNVIGFLHAKDLIPSLARGESPGDIKKVIRPVRFVPEGKMIDELLRELQQKKEHIAIVVDEYGGMAGIVCLENILEEIVGEIQDEYDNEEEEIEKISDSTYICDARTLIQTIEQELDLELPTGGSDTIGGFVFDMFGKIPNDGESISSGNMDFTVESMEGNRIKKVRIRISGDRETEKTSQE